MNDDATFFPEKNLAVLCKGSPIKESVEGRFDVTL